MNIAVKALNKRLANWIQQYSKGIIYYDPYNMLSSPRFWKKSLPYYNSRRNREAES